MRNGPSGKNPRPKVQASFSPKNPPMMFTASVEKHKTSAPNIPGTGRLSERLAGAATGKSFTSSTAGVGRDELLKKTFGPGRHSFETKWNSRGWDVTLRSLLMASQHTGVFALGLPAEGVFFFFPCAKTRSFILENLRMNSGAGANHSSGARLRFGRECQLDNFETGGPAGKGQGSP